MIYDPLIKIVAKFNSDTGIVSVPNYIWQLVYNSISSTPYTNSENLNPTSNSGYEIISDKCNNFSSDHIGDHCIGEAAYSTEKSYSNAYMAYGMASFMYKTSDLYYTYTNDYLYISYNKENWIKLLIPSNIKEPLIHKKGQYYYLDKPIDCTTRGINYLSYLLTYPCANFKCIITQYDYNDKRPSSSGYIGHNGYLHFTGNITVYAGYEPIKLANEIYSSTYWTNLKPTVNTTNYTILFLQLITCNDGLIKYRITNNESNLYSNTLVFSTYNTTIPENIVFAVPISVQYMYINYAYTQVFNKIYIFTESGKIYNAELDFLSIPILVNQTFSTAFKYIFNDKNNKRIYAFQPNGEYICIDFNNSYNMGSITVNNLGLDQDEYLLDHSSTVPNHYLNKITIADKYLLTSKRIIAINLFSGTKLTLLDSNLETDHIEVGSKLAIASGTEYCIQLINFNLGTLKQVYLKTINYNLDNMQVVYSHYLEYMFGMTRYNRNILGVYKFSNNRIIVNVGAYIYEIIDNRFNYLGSVLNIQNETFYYENAIEKITYIASTNNYLIKLYNSSHSYFTSDFITYTTMLEFLNFNDRIGSVYNTTSTINDILVYTSNDMAIMPNITQEIKLPIYSQAQLTTDPYSLTPICSFAVAGDTFYPYVRLNLTGDLTGIMTSVKCLNPSSILYGNTYYSSDPYEYFAVGNSSIYFEHYDLEEAQPLSYTRQYVPGYKQLHITIYANNSQSINFNGSLQSIDLGGKLIYFPFNELSSFSFIPTYQYNKILFCPFSYPNVSELFGFNSDNNLCTIDITNINDVTYFNFSWVYEYQIIGLKYLYSSWNFTAYYTTEITKLTSTKSSIYFDRVTSDIIPTNTDINRLVLPTIGNKSFLFNSSTQLPNLDDNYLKLPDRVDLIDAVYFIPPSYKTYTKEALVLASTSFIYMVVYNMRYNYATIDLAIRTKKYFNFSIIKLAVINNILVVLGENIIAWSVDPASVFTEININVGIKSIYYFNSKYIIGSIDSILVADSLVDFNPVTISLQGVGSIYDIVDYNSVLYCLCSNNIILKSTDGLTFTPVITGLDFNYLCLGKSSEGLLLGGKKGKLAYTNDSINWHFVETNITNDIASISKLDYPAIYCTLKKNILDVSAFINSFGIDELYINDEQHKLELTTTTKYEAWLKYNPQIGGSFSLVNIIPWSSKFKTPKIGIYLDNDCTKLLEKATFYSGELNGYQGSKSVYYYYSWSTYYGIGYSNINEIFFKFPLEPNMSISYVVCSLTMHIIPYTLEGHDESNTDPIELAKLNGIQHFDAFNPIATEKEFSFVVDSYSTDDNYMYVTCKNTKELKKLLVRLESINSAPVNFKGRVVGCSIPTTYIDFLEPLNTDTSNELSVWLKQTDNSVYYDNVTIISRLINDTSNIQPKFFPAKPISDYYNYYYNGTESCLHNNSLAITNVEFNITRGQFITLYKNGTDIEFIILYGSGSAYSHLTGYVNQGFPDISMYDWFNRTYYSWPASDTDIHYTYDNNSAYPNNNTEFVLSNSSKLCVGGLVVTITELNKISTLPLAYKGKFSYDSIDIMSLLFSSTSNYSRVGSLLFNSDLFKSLGEGYVGQIDNGYTIIDINATMFKDTEFYIMCNSRVYLNCKYLNDSQIGIASTGWYMPTNNNYYTPIESGTFEIFYFIHTDNHSYSSTGSQELYVYQSGQLEFNSNDNNIWANALDISDIRYNIPKQIKIRHSGVNAFSTLELLNSVRIAGIEYT